MGSFGRSLDLDLPEQEKDKVEQRVGVRLFPSKSNPKTMHEVTRDSRGNLYCSCPAWKFQKKPVEDRSCKHTMSVIVRGG
jgi:hypothetical protein